MSNQDMYVIVPVKVRVENGNVVSADPPDHSDVVASLNGLGSVSNKQKLLDLLKKFGPMAKSFIKTL